MEVAVSALRAELKTWIEAARAGEDVIITERGVPVARLTGIGAADLVQSLVRDGLLTPAAEPRTPHEPPAAGPATRGGMSSLVRRIRR